MYIARLETVGRVYEGKGETPAEALDDIKMEWNQIKGKGTITLSDDKASATKLYTLPKLRPIFANKLRRQMQAKYLNVLLEANKLAQMSAG